MKHSRPVEVLFTRAVSVGKTIEQLLGAARTTADAALYRLNHPRLARALRDAARRGVRVRVILDREKYELTPATQQLVAKLEIPHRLMSGRQGPYAKMHHKFAVLDGRVAVTGSYNWTLESEESNYENFMIVREPELVKRFAREFEALWSMGPEGRAPRRRPRGRSTHSSSQG